MILKNENLEFIDQLIIRNINARILTITLYIHTREYFKSERIKCISEKINNI